MNAVITCCAAFLGVTNWLILGRPFEDSMTHSFEGMHLPQPGPESAENDLPPASRPVRRPGSLLKVGGSQQEGMEHTSNTNQGETVRCWWPGLWGPFCTQELCFIGICMGTLISLQVTWPGGQYMLRISVKTVFPGNYLGKMLFSQPIPPKRWCFLPHVEEGNREGKLGATVGSPVYLGPKGWVGGPTVLSSLLWLVVCSICPQLTSLRKRKWQQELGTRGPNAWMKARVTCDTPYPPLTQALGILTQWQLEAENRKPLSRAT